MPEEDEIPLVVKRDHAAAGVPAGAAHEKDTEILFYNALQPPRITVGIDPPAGQTRAHSGSCGKSA